MTGTWDGYYGIWNPNTRGWIKRHKSDRMPAFFVTREAAQLLCDRFNAKHNR